MNMPAQQTETAKTLPYVIASIRSLLKGLETAEEKFGVIDTRLCDIEEFILVAKPIVNAQNRISSYQANQLNRQVKRRVMEVSETVQGDKRKHFSKLWSEIHNLCGVNTYLDIPVNKYDLAMERAREWYPVD